MTSLEDVRKMEDKDKDVSEFGYGFSLDHEQIECIEG